MITKNKLIYDILNIVRGGKISDDELISERQVGFWVDNTRALLIKREMDKKDTVSRELVQTLGCVEVAPIDASLCPCNPVGCDVLRTVNPIPTPLSIKGSLQFTRIGTLDVTKPAFSFISFQRASFAGNNKYTKKIVKAFYSDNHIYLITEGLNSLMKHISIQGIFESPEEVANYSICEDSDEPCYSNDSTYPLSAWMVEPLKEMIINNDIRIASQSPSDNIGNANHDINQNTPS